MTTHLAAARVSDREVWSSEESCSRVEVGNQ
jgi:hypothetical protein